MSWILPKTKKRLLLLKKLYFVLSLDRTSSGAWAPSTWQIWKYHKLRRLVFTIPIWPQFLPLFWIFFPIFRYFAGCGYIIVSLQCSLSCSFCVFVICNWKKTFSLFGTPIPPQFLLVPWNFRRLDKFTFTSNNKFLLSFELI